MMLGTFAAESKQHSIIPMALHERIATLRKRAGLTQQDLAQRVSAREGLTQPILRQAVTQWENGSSKPERRRLPVVAEILGVTVEDLLSDSELPPPPVAAAPHGRPPAAAAEVAAASVPVALEIGRRGGMQVPVVGEIRGAGERVGLTLHSVPSASVDFPTVDRDAYALRVMGDELAPRYRPGEFLVLEPSFGPQPGEDVLVRCKNGKVHLRVLAWKRDDMLQLFDGAGGTLTMQLDELDSVHPVGGHVLRRHA